MQMKDIWCRRQLQRLGMAGVLGRKTPSASDSSIYLKFAQYEKYAWLLLSSLLLMFAW